VNFVSESFDLLFFSELALLEFDEHQIVGMRAELFAVNLLVQFVVFFREFLEM